MVNRLDPLKASLIVAQAHGRFRGVRLTGPAWFADHVERIVENAPGVNYFIQPFRINDLHQIDYYYESKTYQLVVSDNPITIASARSIGQQGATQLTPS